MKHVNGGITSLSVHTYTCTVHTYTHKSTN